MKKVCLFGHTNALRRMVMIQKTICLMIINVALDEQILDKLHEFNNRDADIEFSDN